MFVAIVNNAISKHLAGNVRMRIVTVRAKVSETLSRPDIDFLIIYTMEDKGLEAEVW